MARTVMVPRNTSAPEAPPAAPPTPQSVAPERHDGAPTTDEIAREAYLIYLANGAVDGQDMDHWLEAERRLQERDRTAVS